MRRCVFLIIFVLLIQTLQIYAQTHNPMPLFPDDETHDGLYFPNALLQGELSAEFPVRRLLIWADEGDTLQASMTRMSGEYFPAMELYNSEGELLASVLSSEESGYLSTSPLAFTIQRSAWYYLHLSHMKQQGAKDLKKATKRLVMAILRSLLFQFYSSWANRLQDN